MPEHSSYCRQANGSNRPAFGQAGGVPTTELSWRWVFLINVPIGVALVAVAMTSLTATQASRSCCRCACTTSGNAVRSVDVLGPGKPIQTRCRRHTNW